MDLHFRRIMMVPVLILLGLLWGSSACAHSKPLSTKITENVVPAAVESSLDQMAKPETQRDLATVMSSPAIANAVHDISGAAVRGILDALTDPQYKGAFEGSGKKMGDALRQDIAPGVAAVASRTLDASLTTALSDEHQQRMQAAVHGIVAAAIAGAAQGIEQDLGPAMARTMEKDLAPAMARSVMLQESQQAIAMTTQQLAQHLIRGSSGEIDRVSDNREEGNGLLGMFGGKVALGYAIAVFVAFAFGTLMVVLAVMLARSSQHRRKLEMEAQKREEAFLSLMATMSSGQGGPNPALTPEVQAWVREQMDAVPSP